MNDHQNTADTAPAMSPEWTLTDTLFAACVMSAILLLALVLAIMNGAM